MSVAPYQLIRALGGCPVGTVWSATDLHGNPLTIAFLDPAVAQDSQWREAFAKTAQDLAQQRIPYAFADFAAGGPWVAYVDLGGPGAERIFQALGMDYRPNLPPAAPGSGPAQPPVVADPAAHAPWQPPGAAAAFPVGIPEQPVSGGTTSAPSSPVPGAAPVPDPVDPHATTHQHMGMYGNAAPPLPVPVTGPPASGPPTSPAPMDWPVQPFTDMSPPTSGVPAPDSPPPPWLAAPEPVYYPAGPGGDRPDVHLGREAGPRRRTGLRVVIGAVVLLILIGSGAAVLAFGGFLDGKPTASSSPTAAASSALPPPPPTANPQSPGIEPPKTGTWPAAWPKFAAADHVQTLSGLGGLGFTIKVPPNWQCVSLGRAQGYAKYQCGVAPGVTPQLGGELIVRSCDQPCDETRQTAMRKVEEAWGLPWIRAGTSCFYAESSSLQTDGTKRYGLVVVGFYNGGGNGLDHEVVLRMTAPVDGAGQIRRVANYLRDTLVF